MKCGFPTAGDVDCQFKIGSWTYDGLSLNLTNSSDNWYIDTYSENSDYELGDTRLQRNVAQYECCPEPYIDISFYLQLHKTPGPK